MNDNYIIVFDFETDHIDPTIANPIQLAAVAIHPRSLKILEGSEFNSLIQPPDINDKDYEKIHASTISWHAKNKNTTEDNILEIIKSGPSEQSVWENFQIYLKKYHTQYSRQTKFTAPIAAGANIIKFDLIIAERLNLKYNIDYNFHPRDAVDLLNVVWLWFENKDGTPKSHSVDSLREYFGINKEGAHDALNDVTVCANLIIKFLNLHRRVSVKFKDSFK